MPIDFPSSPTQDQEFTSGSTIWIYNGTAWQLKPVTSLTVDAVTASDITVADLNVTNSLSGVDLNDLGDVQLNSPANQQVLRYNSSLGKWQNDVISSSFNGGTITNPLIVNNSTVSTSSSTGALRVTGGVGIGDDLVVGGTIIVEDENIDLKTSANVRFYNTTNTNYVGLSAPDNISANKIYVLPQTDGSNGQYLRTNGSGVLSWGSATSPSGGTPPGGLTTQIQFNDELEFGGDASFTFDKVSQAVTLANIIGTGTDASTSPTTGAAKFAGGVGIAGQLNVGGTNNNFTNDLGVGGDITVTGNVVNNTTPSSTSHLTNKAYVDANILAFSVAFGA